MRAKPDANWAKWAERWEAQQQRFWPRREQRFQIMLDLVEEIVGPEPGRILDLACGPGSMSRRVMKRFPGAQLVALDVDPVLMEIGRRALGNGGGRLQWVGADLRTPTWPEQIRALAPFDAALTSSALHWLDAGEIVHVYRVLSELVRPGGAVLNAEHLMVARPAGRLAGVAKALRQRIDAGEPFEGETSAAWWEAARAEPQFAPLFAERDTVFSEGNPRRHVFLTSSFHEEALSNAGFSEAAVVWRFLEDAVVCAIR
ncbi:MAG: methyltransferase [Chloroflexi bacterium]|nr:methyltransferase [Chloroflexota bacterium]